jgi:hypothetical protein
LLEDAFLVLSRLLPARLMQNTSIDIAERNGDDFRRVLLPAGRLSDRAIRFGSRQVNTPCSSSSAKLSRVTLADHLPDVRCVIACAPWSARAGRHAEMVESKPWAVHARRPATL